MEKRVKSTRFVPIQSRFSGIGPVRLVTRNTRVRTTIPFVDNFVAFTSVMDASNARVVFAEMNRTRALRFIRLHFTILYAPLYPYYHTKRRSLRIHG